MLAAPILEGTLPAFFSNEEGTATITVPFSMSKAVHENEVKSFCLKLKPINNGDPIITQNCSSIDFKNLTVDFTLSVEDVKDLKIGTFYKAQLAYVSYSETNSIGHFSTVSIIKYTTRPKVYILNLSNLTNNFNTYEYTGVYSQQSSENNEKDATEKEYSYRFVVTDLDGTVIEDTGFLIHNNSNDVEYYESKDTFMFSRDIKMNEKYIITYTVRTNNGLEISSFGYKIISQQAIISELDMDLIADLNYDNGYISLHLVGGKDESGYEKSLKGYFLLSRSSSQSNYTKWEELDRFTLAFQLPSIKYWKDFTIQQGIDYKYSVQQYNKDGLYSERIVSNSVTADFEDCFLYDGERQLKIKFNPKISSFKKDILETKVDTIGSKYPFIFRNGQVAYKEFPISGLISYQMDEEGLFYKQENDDIEKYRSKNNHSTLVQIKSVGALPDENFFLKNYNSYYIKIKHPNIKKSYLYFTLNDYLKRFRPDVNILDYSQIYKIFETMVSSNSKEKLYENFEIQNRNVKSLTNPKATDLISENILKERNFKLEVLEWLTNGKPKLFRSSTEGNYLVRLMNVSLAPEDKLGRMLHSFQATAYEIADLTYESLVDYNIITIDDVVKGNQHLKISTVQFCLVEENNLIKLNNDINYCIKGNHYFATGPLTKFGKTIEWASIVDMTPGSIIIVDGEPIVIGSTGSYDITVPVSQIVLGNMVQKKLTATEFNNNNSKKYYTKTTDNLYVLADSKFNSENTYYENDFICSRGQMTYGFYGELNDSFSQIIRTDSKEVIGQQFIGENKNIINQIEDITKKVIGFYDIKINKRPISDIKLEGTIFKDSCNNKIGDLVEYKKVSISRSEYEASLVNNVSNKYYYYSNGNYIKGGRYYNSSLSYYVKGRWIDFIPSVETYKNPLLLYKYKCRNTSDLTSLNYCHVQFLDLDQSDKYHLKQMNNVLFEEYPLGIPPENSSTANSYYKQIRDKNYRQQTTVNPYLKDFRDFDLYVKYGNVFAFNYAKNSFIKIDTSSQDYIQYVKIEYEQMGNISQEAFNEYCYIYENGDFIPADYDAEKVYYLQVFKPLDEYNYFITEDYELITDGTNTYLSEESYNNIKHTYDVLKINIPNLPYKIYASTAIIGEEQNIIDVRDTGYFSTGPMERIKLLQTSIGVYTELFYQQQILNYNISENLVLTDKKKKLDEYNTILSTAYMMEQCVYSKDENKVRQYILDLNDVYSNYKTKYSEYINLLQDYLDSLEREV